MPIKEHAAGPQRLFCVPVQNHFLLTFAVPDFLHRNANRRHLA
jgi:hypothetical protein